MKVCLVYHQRLGDIIRVLPIARDLARHGHAVFVECFPQYWGIFDCISYASPSEPEARCRAGFDRVIDLQIWPNRYDEFRMSGKPWGDFVFGLFPEFTHLNQRPDFDRIDDQPTFAEYGMSSDVCLLAAFGYSQGRRHQPAKLIEACRRVARKPLVMLADQAQKKHLLELGVPRSMVLCATSAGHLPRLIRDASEMFTINSAPCIIAGAVRSQFWHVSSGVAQDDAFSSASRVLTVDD